MGYQPTPPEMFHEAIGQLRICYEYFTFVDLGCGKGLTLLLASDYRFRRIIGVEASHNLTRIAEENLRTYIKRAEQCKDVQVLCSDARSYEFPTDPLVLFMCNPFNGEPMARVYENLMASKERQGREIFVIYVIPVEKKLFRRSKLLKEGSVIVPPGSASCPSGFAADYCIYQL